VIKPAATRFNIAYGTCRVSPEIVAQNAKLHELGILPRDTKEKLPTTPEELVQRIKDFELWTASN
jgi:hypothetical protein